MNPRTAHVHLEIEVASEPIVGRVTGPRGDAHGFSGWIELTQAIEEARLARTGECERPPVRGRYRAGPNGELGRQLPGGIRQAL